MPIAYPGTISHGTLRTQDLLRAFATELERLSGDRATPPIVEEARGCADLLDADSSDATEVAAAFEVLTDLEDYLEEFAPEGHYFGAHAGDGSDFGFWPVED